MIGTREYRSGDSLRQIHWRSTARTGQLVVKEFSDDEQQAFTVVLDLQADLSIGAGKFSTFETAIRLAASIGYYATQKDIPLRLVGSSPKWTPPAMPLGWWGLLNYLAKVQNDGHEPLAKGAQPPARVYLCGRPDQPPPRNHHQSPGRAGSAGPANPGDLHHPGWCATRAGRVVETAGVGG
ncbi:MAG: DUF58 domain-containing protein [Anaerolineales bacterium]|nr:DUF58 domain-containing protein [Anaerolineales bacterium]